MSSAPSPWHRAAPAVLAMALIAGGTVRADTPQVVASDATAMVTVVVEIQLRPGTEPAAAQEALADLRTLMRRQPGFVSEQLLKNLNPASTPQFVHTSRWATIAYWSAMFARPEFVGLSAHGNAHYTITASGFIPAD